MIASQSEHGKLSCSFIERLETELEDRKFFRDEGLKPTMVRNIRNMFIRTGTQRSGTAHAPRYGFSFDWEEEFRAIEKAAASVSGSL